MAVSTKYLDRRVRMSSSYVLLHQTKGVGVVGGTNRVVSDKKEQVNRLVKVDRLNEPVLLDHVGGLNDLGNVGVAREVEEHTEGHDAEAYDWVSA